VQVTRRGNDDETGGLFFRLDGDGRVPPRPLARRSIDDLLDADVSDSLRQVAVRLGHDLGTRFADALVTWKSDGDDLVCAVFGDGAWWGFVGEGSNDPDDWTTSDTEWLVAHCTGMVCDNLWPDDLTDPWPACPVHSDHPLNPCVWRGVASWHCDRDGSATITIGELERP
jgi:hypothetical protein